MTPLFVTPIDILVGVSFGLVFGAATAALVGCVSAATTYVADETIPPIAGGGATAVVAAGGLYGAGVADASTAHLGHGLGIGCSLLLGLYATSWGAQLAGAIPRLTGSSVERMQPLAADAIDAVDAVGQVTVRTTGGVREFEGYPPLAPALRTALENGAWRLPADLPLSALEARLEDRLRTTDDLEAVSVAVDGRGRATITAAPPTNGVAKAVPEGWRAVSVRALVPTGLRPGDEVLTVTDSGTVAGAVLGTTGSASTSASAVTDGGRVEPVGSGPDRVPTLAADSDPGAPTDAPTAPARGGEGRVTVAAPTTDAERLLEADRVRLVVTPGETTAESDAISLLERAGTAIRSVTVTESVLEAIADADTDLDAFAVRGDDAGDDSLDGEWRFDPDPNAITVGTEAFLLSSDRRVLEAEPMEIDGHAVEVSH